MLVDATLGRAGHARALLEACPGLLLIGIDADVAAIEAAGELLAPYADRVTLVHARYDEIPAILPPRRTAPSSRTASWACCSTSACPRRSSTTPSAASPTPRTPRWTCGWTARPGPHRRRRRQRLPGRRTRPRAARVRRGAVRPADRRRGGPRARPRPDHLDAAAERDRQGRDPGGHQAYRGQPGQAHLPGAADRGERRARHAAPGAARRAGRAGRRRPRRGAGLPLTRGPHRQAGARAAVRRPDAARPARARGRGDAAVPPAHQGRRAPRQRRSHRQSARGLRPAAGRGTHQAKQHDPRGHRHGH